MAVIKIRAYNYKDATEIAKQYGFEECRNMTRRWIKAGRPTSPNKLKEFQVDTMLNYKLWQGFGKGYVITLKQGVHMRKNQWKLIHYAKYAPPKLLRTFEIRLEDGDVLVGKTDSKIKALKLAKRLMSKYRETMVCDQIYKVPNPRFRTFRLEHGKTEKGQYIIFGLNKNFKRYDEIRADF